MSLLVFVPTAHAQTGPANTIEVSVLHANDAYIIGATLLQSRSVLWAVDRKSLEATTLYTTPHRLICYQDLNDKDGIVFIVERRLDKSVYRSINQIIIDQRDGQLPKLQLLPADDEDIVYALGVHEPSNTLILKPKLWQGLPTQLLKRTRNGSPAPHPNPRTCTGDPFRVRPSAWVRRPWRNSSPMTPYI